MLFYMYICCFSNRLIWTSNIMCHTNLTKYNLNHERVAKNLNHGRRLVLSIKDVEYAYDMGIYSAWR